MLLSAELVLPKQVLTTGFFTVDGQKISKSLGNVIDPVEFIKKYNKDLLVMYLLSSFHIGQDGDFSEKDAVLTYNAKLANNLGNLVNRVVVLTLKLNSTLQESVNGEVEKRLEETKSSFYGSFERYVLKDSLDAVFTFLDSLNKYVDEKAPWALIKDESNHEEVKHILYTVAESLRQVGLFLYPFFPEKMSELFSKL